MVVFFWVARFVLFVVDTSTAMVIIMMMKENLQVMVVNSIFWDARLSSCSWWVYIDGKIILVLFLLLSEVKVYLNRCAYISVSLSSAAPLSPQFIIDVELLGFVYHWGLDVNSITVIGEWARYPAAASAVAAVAANEAGRSCGEEQRLTTSPLVGTAPSNVFSLVIKINEIPDTPAIRQPRLASSVFCWSTHGGGLVRFGSISGVACASRLAFLGSFLVRACCSLSPTFTELIMAVGLVVDYMVHIVHYFLHQDPNISKDDRIANALGEIGPSVLVGAMTTFLGILPLAAANNAIFRVFFKMFLVIISFGVSLFSRRLIAPGGLRCC